MRRCFETKTPPGDRSEGRWGKGGERRRPIAASGAGARRAVTKEGKKEGSGEAPSPRSSSSSAAAAADSEGSFADGSDSSSARRALSARSSATAAFASASASAARGAAAAAAAALRQGRRARRGLSRALARACSAAPRSPTRATRGQERGGRLRRLYLLLLRVVVCERRALDAILRALTCLLLFFLTDGVLPFFPRGRERRDHASARSSSPPPPSRTRSGLALALVRLRRRVRQRRAELLEQHRAGSGPERLTPSASENSTRSVTLCPSAKNRAACAAFTLRSCALMWGRRRRTLI